MDYLAVKRANDICSVVRWSQVSRSSFAYQAGLVSPLLGRSLWLGFDADLVCVHSHHQTSCESYPSAMNVVAASDLALMWTFLARRVIRVKCRASCKLLWTTIALSYFVALHILRYQWKDLFFYLNVDALFWRIGLATTEWWSFEDHPLTHPLFVTRTLSIDGGRHFSSRGCSSNSIAAIMRKL